MPVAGADHRLAAPAVAAWASAAGCLSLPGRVALVLGVLLAAGALVAARTSRAAVALVLVAAAAAAALAGLRVLHADAGPLPGLARERAVVGAELVLTSDPRLVRGAYGDQVLVTARTVEVTGRGSTVRGRAPVLVFAPESTGLLEAMLGSRIDVVGRLAAARSAEHSAVLQVSRVEGVVRPAAWWWTVAARLRDAVDRAVDERGQAGELVPALVVGDDSGLSEALAADFRSSGLTHLLAVSGTNLTLVLGALLLVARTAGVRGRGLVAVGVAGAIGFVLLARPEPSVLRAAAMGLVALIGVASGDRQRGLRALAVAVLVLLLVDPWLSRSVGFLLSTLATAAILLLAPGWRDALTRWLPRWAAEALAVPLSAQLACTPVVAAISGQASLVAVLANVLAAPAVGPATVFGLLAGLVGLGSPTAGDLAGWLAVVPAGWIVAVGRVSAGLPGASVAWDTSAPALGLLAGLCALVALGAGAVLRRRGASALLALLLVMLVLRPLPTPGWPPAGWVLVACDVGQGDALALAAGDGAAVVVDVGPEPLAVQDCLRDLDVTSVSAVLLSHLHADHVDGLVGVLDQFPVGQVALSPVRSPESAWTAVAGAAAEADVPVRTLAAGQRARLGPLTWQVLAPAATIPASVSESSGSTGSPVNDASLVLAVETAGLRLLMTGDIEPPAQAALVGSGVDLAADVLKIPHHGSARQDPAFLAAVDPRLAVVCVGLDNGYGHPSAGLLGTLEATGVEVARTDLDGDVAVVAGDDGLEWAARGTEGGAG